MLDSSIWFDVDNLCWWNSSQIKNFALFLQCDGGNEEDFALFNKQIETKDGEVFDWTEFFFQVLWTKENTIKDKK